MANHPKVNELREYPTPGTIYTYTNAFGYKTTVRVTRTTQFSIFVQSLADDGVTWLPEGREGVKSFAKFIKEK